MPLPLTSHQLNAMAATLLIAIGCAGLFSGRCSPDYAPDQPNIENTICVFEQQMGQCGVGWQSENEFASGSGVPIKNPLAQIAHDVYLLAEPHVVTDASYCDPEHTDCKGMRVALVNATGRRVVMNSCLGTLSILQEARDAGGLWRPIEHPQYPLCGQSDFDVALGSGKFWSWPVCRYRGSLPTMLRFRLRLGNRTIYSNQFAGSINPSQFQSRFSEKIDAPTAPPKPIPTCSTPRPESATSLAASFAY